MEDNGLPDIMDDGWNDVNVTAVTEAYSYNTTYGNVTYDNVTSPPPVEAGFPHHLIYIPIQILVSFCSVISNLLTILALSQLRASFQPHLILVVNLSISDMLFGLRNVIIRGIMLGFHYNDDLRMWFKDICARGLIRVLGTAIYTCTYINLLAMACDLYFAIMKPFVYQNMMTRRRAVILAIMLWVISFLLAGTNYFVSIFHWFGTHKTKTFCEIRIMHQHLDVYVYLFVVYTGIIAMTYLYVRVFVEVRRCAKYTPGLPVNNQQKVKRNKRKIITSLLVLLTFLLAWLPNGIFTTLYFLMDDFGGTNIALAGRYLATLPMLNSICDPMIYAIRLDKVRIGFRKLCGKSTHRPLDMYASEMTEHVILSEENKTNGHGDYKYTRGSL